jgi:hypothetical protein
MSIPPPTIPAYPATAGAMMQGTALPTLPPSSFPGQPQPGLQPLPKKWPVAAPAVLPGKQSPALRQHTPDPAVMKQMEPLLKAAQQGQLSPDMLAQMANKLPPEMRAQLNTLAPQLATMPQALGNLTPGGILAGLGTVGAIGIGVGKGMDKLMSGASQPNSLLVRVLKAIEGNRLGQVLNQLIETHQTRQRPKHPWVSSVDAIEGNITQKRYMQDLLRMHLGPGGHFESDIKTLGLPSSMTRALANASSRLDILRVLDPNPVHAFPEPLKAIVSKELPGRPWVLRGVDWILQWTKPVLRPIISESFALKLYGAPGSTLKQLDRLLDRHTFMTLLNAAEAKGNLGTGVYQAVCKTLEAPAAAGTLAHHAGDRFVQRLSKLLQQNSRSELGQNIRRVLALRSDISETAICQAIKLKATDDLRKPLWHTMQQTMQGLLRNPAALSSSTQVSQLPALFGKNHSASRLTPSASGKLRHLLTPFVKRLKHIEGHYLPLVVSKNTMFRQLNAQGVGHVGKLLAKPLYHLQRILNGNNFNTYLNLANKTIADKPSILGMLGLSLFIFGIPVMTAATAPKESRIAQFFDGLSRTTLGYIGFETIRNLIQETHMLARWPKLSRMLHRPLIFGLPATRMGLVIELVIPLLGSLLCEHLASRVSHRIFGDPEAIERQKAFTEDAKRSLNSQKGILDQVARGEDPLGLTGQSPFVSNPADINSQALPSLQDIATSQAGQSEKKAAAYQAGPGEHAFQQILNMHAYEA